MTEIEKVQLALDWLEHWEVALSRPDCEAKLPMFVRGLDRIKRELTTTEEQP